MYLYTKQRSCDDDWLYYDGCVMTALNSSPSLTSRSSPQQSTSRTRVHTAPRAAAACRRLAQNVTTTWRRPSRSPAARPAARPYEVWYHAPEIMVVGVGADEGWLWDYLHCSRTQVYFLLVSDGIDNCATAMIIYSMCGLVIDAAPNGSTSEQPCRTMPYLAGTDTLPAVLQTHR